MNYICKKCVDKLNKSDGIWQLKATLLLSPIPKTRCHICRETKIVYAVIRELFPRPNSPITEKLIDEMFERGTVF